MIKKVYKVLPGSGIRIKKSGFFNFDKLYTEMKEWFDDHDYIFHEKEHTEKEGPLGKEVMMKWIATREIDDFAKFNLEIQFFIEKLIKIDKRSKGELRITFFANVELDYKNNWQKNPFTKFLFTIYNNYIIKGKILGNYEPKIKSDIEELRQILKENLE
ncbi:MAG: hypothetical protein PHF86_03960 [Candidatus Nanoarchaeia archaeon]|nr:hypothetical protein [Candidatus Nanoarchaeia archaeon]